MNNNKTYFAVVNENMFGYVQPQLPDTLWIMASTVGAVSHWINGSHPLCHNKPNHRKTTRADFIKFKINIEPYEKDKLIQYDLPKE